MPRRKLGRDASSTASPSTIVSLCCCVTAGPVVRGDRAGAEPPARHREGPDSPGTRAAQGSHSRTVMTRCPETSRIQDWLDGELLPERAARLEAHVAGCAECRAEATAYRALFAELRS